MEFRFNVTGISFDAPNINILIIILTKVTYYRYQVEFDMNVYLKSHTWTLRLTLYLFSVS